VAIVGVLLGYMQRALYRVLVLFGDFCLKVVGLYAIVMGCSCCCCCTNSAWEGST
jgi:hypothetical protein